jgi:hypothetical protein
MKKPRDNSVFVRFSSPDPITSIVNVTRILSDGTEEAIGVVYPIFDNESDSVNYVSINNFGQEIFPPTSDFIEVENQFQKSVKQNADISITEDMEAELEEYENRSNTIKNLRQFKLRTSRKFITR